MFGKFWLFCLKIIFFTVLSLSTTPVTLISYLFILRNVGYLLVPWGSFHLFQSFFSFRSLNWSFLFIFKFTGTSLCEAKYNNFCNFRSCIFQLYNFYLVLYYGFFFFFLLRTSIFPFILSMFTFKVFFFFLFPTLGTS